MQLGIALGVQSMGLLGAEGTCSSLYTGAHQDQGWPDSWWRPGAPGLMS